MKSAKLAAGALLGCALFVSIVETAHSQQTTRTRRAGGRVMSLSGALPTAVRAACAEVGDESCAILAMSSRYLGLDLFHYRMHIKVGPNPYDRIVLHRVVAEPLKGTPRDARHGVTLLPSHYFDFAHFFLPPGCPGKTVCAAATLAARGIDVWGLDLRTRAVPSTTQDFDFMENWTLETYMADTRLALVAARIARAATVNQPNPRLQLLGFGRSVWLAFALANQETQVLSGSRSIAGLIFVDQAFQYGPNGSTARQLDCESENRLWAQVRVGSFEISTEVATDGKLARSDPNGPSRHDPSFTNREYALMVGAATYLGDAPVPHYHLTAGELDDEGHPIRLIYTEEKRWFDTMASAVPHLCAPFFLDTMAIACGETDVPFDDYLSQITVPTLYIGAAGGYGELGIHSTTLLGSEDITILMVQHQTDENAVVDFGHGDIWFSATAKTEVWEPLAEWIEAH